jgi:hypothetical protein
LTLRSAPVKLCECGCGQPAPIAKWNDKRKGAVKGQPQRFIHGHRRHERRLFVEVGQRIGRGVVIDAEVQIPPSAAEKKPARAARLLCDDGNEYVVRLQNLLGKRPTLSCGCLNREAVRLGRAQSALVVKLPEGRAGRNAVLANYKLDARRRGLCWDLTDEDFDRLTAQDCVYCGGPPASVKKKDAGGRNYNGDFVYNGIDRVDNAVGYTPWNVVTCCGTCNFAKKDHDSTTSSWRGSPS